MNMIDELLLGPYAARVGCIAFNGQPDTLAPLTENRQELHDAIREFNGGGSTEIASALHASRDLLLAGGRPGAQKYVVLLSDGRQSDFHGGDKEAIRAAAEVRNTAELRTADQNGLQILALGFGGAVLETLELIAGPSEKPNACARTVTRDSF